MMKPVQNQKPTPCVSFQLDRTTRAAITVAVFLVLGLPGLVSAQDFTARVDRQEMAENETLSLEVVYTDRADTSAIDFEAALSDFVILNNRPSSQTTIANFKRKSQTSWQLTLMPKSTGQLRIPSFSIGTSRTSPIDIRVSAALDSPESGAPFSAKLVVDRQQAFIGEQILVRVLLTSARNVSNLRGAALDVPATETTIVSQSEFQRVIGGSPFQVSELTYAVFPQKAGILSIPSLQYTGTLRRSRVVVAQTDPVTIEVLDPMDDSRASQKRPWLPADAIALAGEWSGPTDALQVGEPITRTIRIAAASQRAAAILPIELPAGRYKQYLEQPILDDSETSTGILGKRTDRIVLVPTEPGPLQLPAIEIDWWNIDEKRWEVARIPEETLHVLPGPSAAQQGAVEPNAPTAIDTPSMTTVPSDATDMNPFEHRLSLALAGISAILLVICIVLWTRLRRLESQIHAAAPDSAHAEHTARVQSAFNRAMRSLTGRDAASVRRDILGWARLEWPDLKITRLEQVSGQTDDAALKHALESLDRALYRSATDSVDHGSLDSDQDSVDYDSIKSLLKDFRARMSIEESPDRSTLTALYPSKR